MIRRGLICAALLLGSSALLFAEQAATTPDMQSQTKPDHDAERADPGFPQPDATQDEPLPRGRLDCAPAPRAHTLLGQYGCVSGRISRIVFTRKGNIRLYLCPKDQCPFHATVYADDVENVGSLLHLRGRLVAIDGDVRLYHGVPEIKITDRDQISVTAGGSHENDVAPPGTVKERRKREVPTEKAR